MLGLIVEPKHDFFRQEGHNRLTNSGIARNTPNEPSYNLLLMTSAIPRKNQKPESDIYLKCPVLIFASLSSLPGPGPAWPGRRGGAAHIYFTQYSRFSYEILDVFILSYVLFPLMASFSPNRAFLKKGPEL